MDQEKKEYGLWWMWVLVLVIISIIVFSCLDYVGIIGKTIVERKVFEQSYQKKVADEDALSIYDAQLTILRRKLYREDISIQEKDDVQAQIDAITILKSSKGN